MTPPEEVRKESIIPFSFRGLMFVPNYNLAGRITYYKATWKNLFVKLQGDYLSVSDSLHKFYHENNHTFFCKSEIEKCIWEISDRFHVTPSEWKIKRLEIGVNIPTEKEEKYYLNQFVSFKGEPFLPMRAKSGLKSIGVNRSLREYEIKFYNKRQEVKTNDRSEITSYLVRFEIAINNMRVFKPMETGSDLFNADKLRAASEFLKTKFDQIEMKHSLPYDQLPRLQDKTFMAAWKDFDYRNALKQDHPESYRKYLRRFKILSQGCQNNLANELQGKIESALQRQING